ncbi:MAG TPA: M14 family zinc carboxypeptidase [Bacteroidia bacterium]|nr:M14 family zinc carboxypeptidase [Bacteroidia bacterium]
MFKLYKTVLIALLILSAFAGFAQTAKENYSRVKIYTNVKGITALTRLGIETDHGDYRKGVWLITDLSDRELAKVQQAGFKTEVLINDISGYYKFQNVADVSKFFDNPISQSKQQSAVGCGSTTGPVYPVPSHFSLGSMGGYFTYQEMLDNLDSMFSNFPNLITIRQQIGTGTSIEGNPLYYVKISDNPTVSEPEPQMLYTALHHAREPESLSQLLFYMWYLLENYTTDTQIQNIVNNSELYFITCVNPDGYLYNEMTDPGGGGMWRKNRRDNLDGEFGVDLNRNYGYNWGYDDDGSSPVTGDATYRGTAPFSEPETQIVSDFVNTLDFKIALNYHTFGNLLIYPWGYIPSFFTPDSALFVNYGKLLTTYNQYNYGTDDQTVGYIVNGSSDDWMYGEQTTKPKILAMTPEVGTGGFWPPSSEIISMSQGCMYMNITAAQLLGRYAVLSDLSETLIPLTTGYIKFDLKQLGLDTTGSYTVTLAAITSNVSSTGAPKVFSNLSVLQTIIDSISFSLNTTGLLYGDEVKFLLSIDNGQFVVADTLTKYFGQSTVVLSQNNNTMNGWNTSNWGISTAQYYSPTGSITDSPFGDYQSNDFNTLQLTNPVSLTNAVKATLTFYTKWAIEPGYDYAQVAVSTNGGATWTALCGKYTKTGSPNQDPGNPLYDGFQNTWVKEEMSLDDYIGQNILIRFLMASDNFTEYDGFYFDDLEITKIVPGGVGINEISNTVLSVSPCMPNPVSDYAYISYSLPKTKNDAVLIFTDATGRTVKTMTLNQNQSSIKIDLQNVQRGIYFYQIVSGDSRSVIQKLIVAGR